MSMVDCDSSFFVTMLLWYWHFHAENVAEARAFQVNVLLESIYKVLIKEVFNSKHVYELQYSTGVGCMLLINR